MNLEPGTFYHIYNRGNNKENIFKEERNYAYFLSLWQRHVISVADTFAYCLLPNHFHFLIRIKECSSEDECESLSQPFSNVFNAYAKAINKQYNRVGSLFQERFRRKEVNHDAYLERLIPYIHTNAQRHGLWPDYKSYPHSSYRAILSNKPTSLMRGELLALFGSAENFVSVHQSYIADKADSIYFLEQPEDD